MSTLSPVSLQKRPQLAPGAEATAPAPFIKWVGGKGRLLAQLAPMLPPGHGRMRHVEPFVGGGALFFHRRPKRALLTDVNDALIGTYVAVRDHLDAVIERLRILAQHHSEAGYYQARERYNHLRRRERSTADHAALFIYLNKTCFNGLHRVNRSGDFNVPMGRYTNPRILDEETLRRASAALRDAELRVAGFEELLEHAHPGDFIYLDPPYHPLTETASFTAYTQGGFAAADQERLRDVYRALDRRGCKLMLSNSDTPLIRELYAGYAQHTVWAPRAINSNPDRRGNVSELVVCNYAIPAGQRVSQLSTRRARATPASPQRATA